MAPEGLVVGDLVFLAAAQIVHREYGGVLGRLTLEDQPLSVVGQCSRV